MIIYGDRYYCIKDGEVKSGIIIDKVWDIEDNFLGFAVRINGLILLKIDELYYTERLAKDELIDRLEAEISDHQMGIGCIEFNIKKLEKRIEELRQ